MLSCKLNPSIGFVIFGHQSMECRFTQNQRFPPQAYEGALNTVGIDLGVSAGGVLGWAVFAPTAGPPPGALAGEYVGATGEIGVGLGAGVNVLIGGSGRSFALQPVSRHLISCVQWKQTCSLCRCRKMREWFSNCRAILPGLVM